MTEQEIHEVNSELGELLQIEDMPYADFVHDPIASVKLIHEMCKRGWYLVVQDDCKVVGFRLTKVTVYMSGEHSHTRHILPSESVNPNWFTQTVALTALEALRCSPRRK